MATRSIPASTTPVTATSGFTLESKKLHLNYLKREICQIDPSLINEKKGVIITKSLWSKVTNAWNSFCYAFMRFYKKSQAERLVKEYTQLNSHIKNLELDQEQAKQAPQPEKLGLELIEANETELETPAQASSEAPIEPSCSHGMFTVATGAVAGATASLIGAPLFVVGAAAVGVGFLTNMFCKKMWGSNEVAPTPPPVQINPAPVAIKIETLVAAPAAPLVTEAQQAAPALVAPAAAELAVATVAAKSAYDALEVPEDSAKLIASMLMKTAKGGLRELQSSKEIPLAQAYVKKEGKEVHPLKQFEMILCSKDLRDSFQEIKDFKQWGLGNVKWEGFASALGCKERFIQVIQNTHHDKNGKLTGKLTPEIIDGFAAKLGVVGEDVIKAKKLLDTMINNEASDKIAKDAFENLVALLFAKTMPKADSPVPKYLAEGDLTTLCARYIQ